VGTGYRLLPDGLTFSAPVELNFSLEDSLLWGSDTLFVDVAGLVRYAIIVGLIEVE